MYIYPKYSRIYMDSIYCSATGCKKQVLSFRTVVKLLSNFMYLLLGKQLYILARAYYTECIHGHGLFPITFSCCKQFVIGSMGVLLSYS